MEDQMTANGGFRRADFSIETLGNVSFQGFTRGETWNGWQCPYFTRETAEQILKASERNGYRWQYDETSDTYLVQHSADPTDFEPDRFEEVKIEIEGLETKAYAIGAYSWAWEIFAS